jgi:hypothetical protein
MILAELGLSILINQLTGILFGGGLPDLPDGLNWKTSSFISEGLVHTGWRMVLNRHIVPVDSWISPFIVFYGHCIQDSNTGLLVGFYAESEKMVYEFQGFTLEGIPIDSRYPELGNLHAKQMPEIIFPAGAYFTLDPPVIEPWGRGITYPDKTFEPGQSVEAWDVLKASLSKYFPDTQVADMIINMKESAAINASVVYGKMPEVPGEPVSTIPLSGSSTMIMIGIAALLLLLILKGK